MRTPKKQTAVVMAGAVALASAAYGVGTQAGDGTASAARDRGGPDFDVSVRFDGLADELGVDADELHDALRDFHEQEAGERRDAFADALAEALGKPVDEVRAALDEVGPGKDLRRGDGAVPGELRLSCAPHVSLRRLAAELDVTRAELRQALREARAGADSAWEDHRDALAAFLAERFGLARDEVERALPDLPAPGRLPPGGGPRFEYHGPPPFGPGGLPG
jgi:hypothetical protein